MKNVAAKFVVGWFGDGVVGGGLRRRSDYKRPETKSPTHSASRRRTPTPQRHEPFADLGWWRPSGDPQLNVYINEALSNSWDIKIAAARVLQAGGFPWRHALAVFPDGQCRGRGHHARFAKRARRRFRR